MSNLKEILIKKKICKSVWFMRQAGRHLPEFRKIRSKNPNFIKLCLNSNLSSKITLQPIKRYDLDFAIIFSDILMVPYALGQNVSFIKKKGPVLDDFDLKKTIKVFCLVQEIFFILGIWPLSFFIEQHMYTKFLPF